MMENVDRREFLGASLAGGAAAWFAAWFGQDPQGKPTESEAEKALREAVQKAQEQGKPLLVFVGLPGWNGTRATWFGAWVDYADQAALLDVALCVPVCARLAEFGRVTGAAKIDGEPQMLIVDVAQVGTKDAPPPRVTPVAVEMPSLPAWPPGDEGDAEKRATKYERFRAEEERTMRAGLEKLTVAFRKAMHRHAPDAAQAVDDVRKKATAAQRDAIAKWLAGGETPGDDVVLRFAAEIRAAAEQGPESTRARSITALRAAARRQFLEHDLPGGHWRDANCDYCGMGHVPALCERFLWFLTEAPPVVK